MKSASKSVFITGGGSGLGAAVARRLADGGWRVALAGRSAKRLADVSVKAKTYSLDVGDAIAVERAIQDFRPDALVCCAAILGRGEVFSELTPEIFAQVIEVNVAGTFHSCRAAMRLWKEQGIQGDIVNISSLGGIRGLQKFSGFAAYATSKHAIVGLTEALALDGKPYGIRVNAVAPGTMRSAMTEALGLQPKTMPEDIAPTVEFLLDRTKSGSMTGTTIEIHCNDE